MKLITLNIWGGHVREPLLAFIKAYQEVDIFCLQEVYHQAFEKVSTEDRQVSLNIFAELQALLPNHQAFFRPTVDNVYGLGMLIKKNVDIIGEGEVSIHENPNYPGRGPSHARNLQWVECHFNNTIYSILNVHGLWNGKGKTDTPERLEQSHRIKTFVDTIHTPKVLCGDFNLRPDTESMKMLDEGMHNWVRLRNIASTRTSFYTKEEKFADYMLTSPEIEVNHFEVLKDEVSDHAPLFLEFL